MTKLSSISSDVGKFFKISIGLVYVFANLWIIFHLNTLVDEGDIRRWEIIMLNYLVMNVMVLTETRIRGMLFKVQFVDFLKKYAVWFALSFLVYYMILRSVMVLDVRYFSMLSKIPFSLALMHVITFSFTESLVFQGYLNRAVGVWIGSVVFGAFHLFIWEGPWQVVLFGASMLGLIFGVIHNKFGSDSNFAPVAANHAAFNLAKLISVMV